LHWEQSDLAEASKVPIGSIKRIEMAPGPIRKNERAMNAIRQAFETRGVTFTDGDHPSVTLLRGRH
jgi:hypothetical protein